MGTFRARFRLSNPGDPGRWVELEALVDIGASFPFVPEAILASVGISPTGEKTFTFADGTRKALRIGEARLAYGDAAAPCLVVFAPAGAEPLFGALALESLGLEVDPVNRRLKPATLFLAAVKPS